MHDFTPVPSLLGGVLIGLAISLVYFTHGRAAGISGLWAGVLRSSSDRAFRGWFFAGLIAVGVLMRFVYPQAFGAVVGSSLALTAFAGLLVGYGTRLGGGCTSGHGVCGNSRLEARSIVATITFMLTGALAVLAVRTLL